MPGHFVGHVLKIDGEITANISCEVLGGTKISGADIRDQNGELVKDQ